MIEQYFTDVSWKRRKEDTHWRPAYHFTAPSSWMNDPNGLIYFKGWYHLFYQHNPKGCEWGSMHWGHAVSKDMLHWKDLPIALYPDQPYDDHPDGGCFSGSAVEKDGKLYLFYTSTIHRDGKTCQTQSVAFSEDGIHFFKHKDNPVIIRPPEGAADDFRDPKVLEVDGIWYMVVGGACNGTNAYDGDGRVFLYRSEDLYHWDYVGNLLESNGALGTMFECPDLFCLNGKWVLTCSPMNHPCGNKSMYCVGDIDFETGRFSIEKIGNMDYGFDYYAPQSFLDEYGNRVMIAWANEWQWMPWFVGFGPTASENWRGAFNLPRKAELDENLNLILQPIGAFWSLVNRPVIYEQYPIFEKKTYFSLQDPYSYVLHMKIIVSKITSRHIEIGIFEKEDKCAVISLDLVNMLLSFDKRNADCYGKGIMTTAIEKKVDQIDLKILVDHSIVEIFVNDGQKCISCNVYPEKTQTGLWIATPYKEAVLDLLEVGVVNSVWE